MQSRAIVVGGVLAAALVSGGWLLERGLTGEKGGVSRARLFDEVLIHVQRDFVDTLPNDDLYRKALDGMLYELHDPHTVFLTADRFAKLQERTTGNYAGVGIQIDVRDGWLTVVTPLPDTPAERAGIQTGDRIVEIDGKGTKGWTVDEAGKAVRGPAGSKIQVLVERPGNSVRIPFTLAREEIHIRSVPRTAVLDRGVAYVQLTGFSETAASELASAVDSLVRAGAKSLILDLRGNPGGLLDQGIAVSDLFLNPKQSIVETRGRTPEANGRFEDRAPQRWATLPIVVLVNSGSASASEIVAGALQDHDRAVVVGQTSYGKGSAQSVFRMAGGSALKLTTARWFTPSGRSISKPSAVSTPDDEDAEPDTTVATPLKKPAYRTDAKRVVYGGGGIIPDVIVGDTAPPREQVALQDALGRKVPQFRDALTDYALSLRSSGIVSSPDFTVTPAMREELWRRMQSRGISISRAVYDAARPTVDRLLGTEVARYVFGPKGEFLRSTKLDPVLVTAQSLLAGAASVSEPFSRADGLKTRAAADSTRKPSTNSP